MRIKIDGLGIRFWSATTAPPHCLFLSIPIILVFLSPVPRSHGQTLVSAPGPAPDASIRRFEFGGQATDMRPGTCFGTKGCTTPQFGLGPGGAFNINRDLAIDGELNLFPGVDSQAAYFDDGSATGGRPIELLAGVRTEKRAKHYGYFLDAKPGFLSWSRIFTGVEFSPVANGAPAETFLFARRTFFVTKVGGGLEYSPGPRLHARIDFGDLMVRYDNSGILSCTACVHWTNNLQTTAGVYFGAGNPISWKTGSGDSRRAHKFFGKSNLFLMGISLSGQAADAITTQRFLSHGFREGDPLAEPFVKYGWSGQVGLGIFNNAAEIFVMYGLHRMGAHWIERAVPLSIGTVSGVEAYRNLQPD
jgi:hypothetical protein